MKKNTLLVAIVLWLLPAAQSLTAQGGPGSTPWYTVELILFTRNTPPGASGEFWSKAPGELNWESERIADYTTAPRGSWQLTGAKQALTRAGGLTPIIHTAWQQPVYSRKSARSSYLKSDRQITPGTPLVEGTVKVSVSRYLHVDLDLLLRGAPAGTGRLPGGFQTFRFNEHRRMRSRELHYIDHPLMGMLILITPINSTDPGPSGDEETHKSADQAETEEAPQAE
jgi:hypothetical protein